MDQPAGRASFGTLLRQWRRLRGLSQLDLSLKAGVSTRHLSWLEGDRAAPSRAMAIRLATQLALPMRDGNALLAAAGYAPMWAERPLAHPALAPARAALQRLLEAHEPAPALAVDRLWNLVAHNRMVTLLLAPVAQAEPALLEPPANMLRLTLHPRGLAPMIEGFPAWRAQVLQRLARQVGASGDPALRELHAELSALPLPEGVTGAAPHADDAVIVPLVLATPLGRMSFLTTVTVFGAPHDVTLAELAVETLLPADEATARMLREALAAAA